MALVWRPEQLKLEVLCIRNGDVERVLDLTAHGLETVRKNLKDGRLTSSIRAFLDNGGEQLQLVTTRGNKVVSWLETYTYRYATTDDGNEDEPLQKMPRTGPFEPVQWDAKDFDLDPDFQFPLGTPSGIIHLNCQNTASQMKKRKKRVAPSKNVPIVAEPPSVPQARSLLDTFFAPRLPPAKPAVSSSASRIQGLQGAVATYSWGSFGAGILTATVQTDPKAALEEYYAPCPLFHLHYSLRGKIVEQIVERYEHLNNPHGAVQAAAITGHRNRTNTENDYQVQGRGTEVKSGTFQFVEGRQDALKIVFAGIKKELHERCLLVSVLSEELQIFEFDSRVLPSPMPKGGSPKSFLAPKHQRNVRIAVSEIISKMGATCDFLGRVRYKDPNYADLFAALLNRGPIHEAYATSCPLHEVPNSRGIIIEKVVVEVLTDQLSDCKITHVGKKSPYDIKCEIDSKDFYFSFLESKLDQTLAAIVETYVGHLKFEVKTSTIHADSSRSGSFNLNFAAIDRSKFDQLYVAVCLPESIEVFLHDGASGTWSPFGEQGESVRYFARGTDFGYCAGGCGRSKRGNLVDLITNWQKVWTVLKKKMNKCKHIASIRF